jgi:hypothetical protein
MSELSESIPLPSMLPLQVDGEIPPDSPAMESRGSGLGKDDNYRQFADEIAQKHHDLHAHLTYAIHWLYGEGKSGR